MRPLASTRSRPELRLAIRVKERKKLVALRSPVVAYAILLSIDVKMEKYPRLEGNQRKTTVMLALQRKASALYTALHCTTPCLRCLHLPDFPTFLSFVKRTKRIHLLQFFYFQSLPHCAMMRMNERRRPKLTVHHNA